MTPSALSTLDHSASMHSLPSICRNLFTIFIKALAEALAPLVCAHMAEHWESIVAAKARADDHPLSLSDAAKAIKIRQPILREALGLPEESPWHIKHTRGDKRGGVGEAPFIIRRADLEAWNNERWKGFMGKEKQKKAR